MIDLVIDPRDPALLPLGPSVDGSKYRQARVTVHVSRTVRLVGGGFIYEGVPVAESVSADGDPVVVSVPASDGAEVVEADRNTFQYIVTLTTGSAASRTERARRFQGLLPTSLGATVQVTELVNAEPLPAPFLTIGDLLDDVNAAEAAAVSAQSAASDAAASAASAATSSANSAALVGAPADSAIAVAVSGSATATRAALLRSFSPAIFPNAVANGVADDTVAIQAAVDACPVGGVVDGHGLTYLVTSVKLKSDMTFRNFNLKAKPGAVNGVSPVTVGAYSDTTHRQNITIRNVHVDGQRALQTAVGGAEDGARHGFRLLGSITNLLMEDCSAVQCASDGLTLYRGTGMTAITSYSTGIKSKMRFVRCNFSGNRRHGVAVDTATDVVFEDCKLNSNGLNSDGSITPGDPAAGAAGAIMPGPGGIYGNGIDIEEYDLKSYAGDIRMIGCESVGNAKSSVLIYAGPMLASDPNFVTRKGFHFTRCTFDNGIGGNATAYSLEASPPYANRLLGWYYTAIAVVDCNLTGGLSLRSVLAARHEGGTLAPVDATLIVGNADEVGSLTVSAPRGGKRYATNNAVVKYAPDERESLWLGPAQFVNVGGTPVLNATSFIPSWGFSDAETDRVGAIFHIPSDWATAHFDLVWYNGVGSGAAQWRLDTGSLAAGTTQADAASGVPVTATAGAVNVSTVTRVATGRTVAPGPMNLELLRLGADAADTLAGNAQVYGVKITRAS